MAASNGASSAEPCFPQCKSATTASRTVSDTIHLSLPRSHPAFFRFFCNLHANPGTKFANQCFVQPTSANQEWLTMMPDTEDQHVLKPTTAQFYRSIMDILTSNDIPFLVGGSYAMFQHFQMPRRTKDLDLFLLPTDVDLALSLCAAAGFRAELAFSHWLGKVLCGDDFVDIIFNSGNGLCPVDAAWFEHALEGMVLDRAVPLCPIEETIWQKSFIMERHRYDGADVAHLLRAAGGKLDWQRLLLRFGDHWRVLFSHLALFGFIYPDHEQLIPECLRRELATRYLKQTANSSHTRRCDGTLLSSIQYREDLKSEGFEDGRLTHGSMTVQQLVRWDASLDEQPPSKAES
jgi:hypothetical protein